MAQTTAKSENKNLVWIDMEMTGLEPERDQVIEVAVLITNARLDVIAEGPNLVVKQDARLFATMDKWNQETHTKSGLWEKVVASSLSLGEAEQQLLDFVKQWVPEKGSPLCGNSVWQDRRFLYRHMPKFEAHMHYRVIDVSTVKELYRRWYPGFPEFNKGKSAHRALDDIRESIEELKFYREKIFAQTGLV